MESVFSFFDGYLAYLVAKHALGVKMRGHLARICQGCVELRVFRVKRAIVCVEHDVFRVKPIGERVKIHLFCVNA
jgi:hypothetical protein